MEHNEIINKDRFLIDTGLYQALSSGRKSEEKSDKFYLIKFKVLNNKEDKIIYGYISYEEMFWNTLTEYIVYRNLNNSEPDFEKNFILIEDSLYDKKHKLITNAFWMPNPITMRNISMFLNKRNKDLVEIFGMLNSLIFTCSIDTMSTVFDMCYNKKYYELLTLVLSKDFEYKEKYINDIFLSKKINILQNNIFIVKDLQKFLESLSKIDSRYKYINGGPQKYRPQINSINSFLNQFDYEFRMALYSHMIYHYEQKNINKKLSLDKFTFKNIHMNLGDVKW